MADQEIKLKITSDATSAISSLTKFQSQLKTLKSSWGGIAAAMAVPVSLGGVAAFVKSTLEAKDRLDETAQKAGIAATSLQLYEYSARLAGVSNESLVNGIGILSKNMMGAAEDMGGASKAFTALGLSTKDAAGNLKSAEDMIGEIADKFAAMEDGTGKTAIAMALFGKSGKEMIPFLNQGSAGLEDVRQRMIALGYSFDEDAIKKAGEVNDRLDEMGVALKNVASRVVMNFLPELDKMSDTMVRVTQDTEGFKDVTNTLSEGLKVITRWALGVAAAFDLVGTSIGESAARYMKSYEESGIISRITGYAALKATGSALFGGLNDQNSALNAKAETWAKLMGVFSGDQSTTPWEGPSSHTPSKSKAPIIENAKNAKDATDQLAAAQLNWSQVIAALNPLLTEEEKKLQHLSDQAADLKQKWGDQSWISQGLEQGKEYLKLAKDIADEEQMYAAWTKQQADAKKTSYEMSLAALQTETQIEELKLSYQQKRLDLASRYGEISTGTAAATSYDLELNRLQLINNEISRQIKLRRGALSGNLEEDANLEREINNYLNQQLAIQEEINQRLAIRSAVLREHTATMAEGYATGWKKYFDDLGSEFQRGEDYAKDTANAMHRAFEEFFMDPMNYSWDNMWKDMERVAARAMSDIAMNMIRQLIKVAAETNALGLGGFLGGLFGSGGNASMNWGSAWTDTNFGGSFASGGNVSPNKWYIVGERGPEPFIPRTPGTVLPNASLAGAAPVINIINNNGSEISTQTRQTNQGVEIDVMIDNAVASKLATFGSASNKAMRQNYTTSQRLTRR